MSVCYIRRISIEHKFMFEKPRKLNTGYAEKPDNVNVYKGNTLHSLKN